MANEGLVRDSLLKMVHNPGGDWNPGRGDNPTYINTHLCTQQDLWQFTVRCRIEQPVPLLGNVPAARVKLVDNDSTNAPHGVAV